MWGFTVFRMQSNHGLSFLIRDSRFLLLQTLQYEPHQISVVPHMECSLRFPCVCWFVRKSLGCDLCDGFIAATRYEILRARRADKLQFSERIFETICGCHAEKHLCRNPGINSSLYFTNGP